MVLSLSYVFSNTVPSLSFIIRMPSTIILHFAWRYLVTDRYWVFVVGGSCVVFEGYARTFAKIKCMT
jgi:hypothetical protein